MLRVCRVLLKSFRILMLTELLHLRGRMAKQVASSEVGMLLMLGISDSILRSVLNVGNIIDEFSLL